jgi:citrate lyase subunit beta-like protein
VRINHVESGLELDDLNFILNSKHLDAILIPKVHSSQQVYFVSRMIDLLAHHDT